MLIKCEKLSNLLKLCLIMITKLTRNVIKINFNETKNNFQDC
jgi:hypothetical protein